MSTPIPKQAETGVSAKRYDLDPCDGESGHCWAEMFVSPTGDWVSYEDYERELAAQTRRVEELEGALRDVVSEAGSHGEFNNVSGITRLPKGYQSVIAIAARALLTPATDHPNQSTHHE